MTPTLPGWGTNYAKKTANLGLNAAKQWMGDAIDPTQIAGFNPDQTSAFEDVRGFGQSNPYQTALGALTGSAAGNYLYGGPAQDAFINASIRGAAPGVMSAWGSAGRGGGQLGQLQLSQQATDAYAGLYNQERDRMMSAANALPGMAQIPINMMMGIGNQQQQHEQDIFNAQKQAQDQERARDAAVANYAAGAVPWPSVTGQNTTTTGTQNQQTIVPQYTNPVAGALGGAVGGAQMGATIGGPYGAIPGAVLGGVMGYYG
jgi:hypothetical protein